MGINLKNIFTSKKEARTLKNQHEEKFVLKSYLEQTRDYLFFSENINYKDVAFEIIEKLSEKDIVEILDYLFHYNKPIYDKLIQGFENLESKNEVLNYIYYAFQLKIEDDFEKELFNAKNSLNTGDLIAYLLSKYFKYDSKKGLPVIEKAYTDLKYRIVIEIKRNFALLQSEIESKQYLPIEKVLFLFFLYDKDDTLEIFKKVIQKDIETRKFGFHQIEHFVHLERFFERLGISYIPKIENIKNDIKLSKEEDSISKSELKRIINKEDYFNNEIPLLGIEHDKFINPKTEVENLLEVKKLFSIIYRNALIKKYGEKHLSNFKFDFGDVFLENITNPISKFSTNDLIQVREITKELLKDKNSDFKRFFFSLIYTLWESKQLINWGAKFSYLFPLYINNIKGFSKDTIKDFFTHGEKNPYKNYYDEIIKFIESNSKLDRKY